MLTFSVFLLLSALMLNLPLLAVLLLTRRLGRRASAAAVSAGFVLATAVVLWQIEWFDVWRLGVPSAGYIVRAYLPFLAGAALVGWMIGGAIGRRRRAWTVSRT